MMVDIWLLKVSLPASHLSFSPARLVRRFLLRSTWRGCTELKCEHGGTVHVVLLDMWYQICGTEHMVQNLRYWTCVVECVVLDMCC